MLCANNNSYDAQKADTKLNVIPPPRRGNPLFMETSVKQREIAGRCRQ